MSVKGKKKEKKLKDTLRILRTSEYKGFHILVQYIVPSNVLQCVLFRNGSFYQAHDLISPTPPATEHSAKDLVLLGVHYLDTAFLIADNILMYEEKKELEKASSGDKDLLDKKPTRAD